MERVAFLVEPGQQRLGCLLNPESLIARRLAGIQPRRSVGGPLTGAGLRDDRLLFTGGGRTEFELDLLFDVTLAGSSIRTGDVRDLTLPLWNLAENERERRTAAEAAYAGVPLVRLIWGKSWNVPGVIVAVAERLERFSSAGVPQRSWLRLRLVRVEDDAPVPAGARRTAAGPHRTGDGTVWTHELVGGRADVPPTPGEALETAAALVASALERSAVAALLSRTAASFREAAGAILDEVERTFRDAGSTSRAALARVAHEAERLATLILIEPGRRWAERVVAASGELSTTLARGYAALAAVAEEIGDAASRRIRASLDAVAAAVAPLTAAVGSGAAAVRQRVAVLIADSAEVVDAIATEAREVLLPLASAASIVGSALGRAAVEAGQRALDDVTAHLADVRAGGLGRTGEAMRDAIFGLGTVVVTLQDLGEEAAAQALQRGVEGLAAAARTLRTADEGLAAASLRPRIEALDDDARTLRAALGETRPAEEDEPREAAASGEAASSGETVRREAEVVLGGAVVLTQTLKASLSPVGEPTVDAPTDEAIAALGMAVGALSAAMATPAAAIVEPVDDLVRALAAVAASEGPASAALVRGAVAAAATAATAPGGDRDAASRGFGERLEHIAYHHYGDPAAWRLIAVANDLDDPLRLPAGRALRIVAR